MPDESVRVTEAVRSGVPLDEVDPDVLDVNSIRGRRRKTSEITKRLGNADKFVWNDLPDRTPPEQHVVLYYCCLKTYRLLFDFHMDVVLPRWRSSDRSLRPYDVQRFLEERADNHPVIDSWSATTWEKLRQVMLKMLREAGLLKEGRLQPVQLPTAFWARFAKVGGIWFLEALFLNETQRQAVV